MDAATNSVAAAVQLVMPEHVGVIMLEADHTAHLVHIRHLIRASDTTANAPDVLVGVGPQGLTVICAPQQVQRTAGLLAAERISSTNVSPTVQLLESGVLKDALEHWLAYLLQTREGYLSLSGGLLVDMQSTEADAPCSEKLRTAAAVKLSLLFGNQTHVAGGNVFVNMTVCLLFEGRCWKSRDAMSRLLSSDPALATDLRDRGFVDLSADRWWPQYIDPERLCDRHNEVSVLPDHARATILQVSLEPPLSWPNGGGAVESHHHKTPEEYATELGEQLGIWVAPDRLGPFCTVRMDLDGPPNDFFDDGRACTWRIVPAVLVWPSAGMRVVRRASQLPTKAALTRFLRWLGGHAPLGLGALKLLGSASPPTAGITGSSVARPEAITEFGGDAHAVAIAHSALERGIESEPIRSRPSVMNDNVDGETIQAPRPSGSAANHVLKRSGLPLRGISNQAHAIRTSVTLPTFSVAGCAGASRTPLGMSFGSKSLGGLHSSATSTATASAGQPFQRKPARPFNEAPARQTAIKKAGPKAPRPPKPGSSVASAQKVSKVASSAALDGVSHVTDTHALASMKVPELKQQCALRKLKVSGTRAQLLERLGVGVPVPG
jgi:hypothetical protein